MGTKTGIEWADATWNPTTGCTAVSTGCDHCYAKTLAHRLLSDSYLSRTPAVDSVANRENPFAVRLWPERLEQPGRWREPRRIFVNSMSDLFHADIPRPYLLRIFGVMLAEDHHVYQILTKRPARTGVFARKEAHLFSDGCIPRHIWIGTSVENQDVAYRIRHLRSVPSRVRFLSCEPLLGPVELDLQGIHWVIAGGESGPQRRPMELDWARMIRDQCLREGVPFFFKQVGGRTPKAGGRELDGRTWNEFPYEVPEAEPAVLG